MQMLGARDAAMFLVNKAHERANGTGDNISIAILKVEPLLMGDWLRDTLDPTAKVL